MPDAYEYAILRVVPDVAREEFINAGVVLLCETRGYLEAIIALEEPRVLALFLNVDLALVRDHLDAIVRTCRGEGPMGALPIRDRFRWLVAPRNAIVQTSCAHGGLTADPEAALVRLLRTMVVAPR